jgi:hypothetical protein
MRVSKRTGSQIQYIAAHITALKELHCYVQDFIGSQEIGNGVGLGRPVNAEGSMDSINLFEGPRQTQPIPKIEIRHLPIFRVPPTRFFKGVSSKKCCGSRGTNAAANHVHPSDRGLANRS